MAAGDVMLDADGNVLLTSDGNVLLDDGSGDPCACCGGTIGNGLACSNCSNTPPAGFICTITGCDICTGCQAGIGQSATYTGDAVNGTYTLNNTDNCRYGATVAKDFVANSWSNTTCSGSPVSVTHYHSLTFDCIFGTTSISLVVSIDVAFSLPFSGTVSLSHPYDCRISRTILCDSSIICGGIGAYAAGGTAVLTPF